MRELLHEQLKEEEKENIKMSGAVLTCLQECSETFLTELLALCQRVAFHEERKTIMVVDFHMVLDLQRQKLLR